MPAHGADRNYLLGNEQADAGRRFNALAELFDPWTVRHFDDIGVSEGWRCWEVGAGGPAVASWLAARVGPSGYVVATDIDTSWLPDGAAFEVLQHDVAADPPPATDLDLVHARLVLVHLPDRADALRSMLSALRSGGWIVLEDADPAMQPLLCPDDAGTDERLANRLRNGFRELMSGRGADLGYGRTLPRLLREAGLVDVRADAYFPIAGPACVDLELATVAQIRARLVAAGLATDAEIDQHLATVAAGRIDLATAPLISAWGRKP